MGDVGEWVLNSGAFVEAGESGLVGVETQFGFFGKGLDGCDDVVFQSIEALVEFGAGDVVGFWFGLAEQEFFGEPGSEADNGGQESPGVGGDGG